MATGFYWVILGMLGHVGSYWSYWVILVLASREDRRLYQYHVAKRVQCVKIMLLVSLFKPALEYLSVANL